MIRKSSSDKPLRRRRLKESTTTTLLNCARGSEAEALSQIAAFLSDSDGSRANGELEKFGFIEQITKAQQHQSDDDGIPPWDTLSPAAKTIVAARSAYDVSHENGDRFLALLARSLAQDYPALLHEPGVSTLLSRIGDDSRANVKFSLGGGSFDSEIPEWAERPLLAIASYVSGSGGVTVVDLARATPLNPRKQIAILAEAVNNRRAVQSLWIASDVEYRKHGSIVASDRLIVTWSILLADVYPTVAHDPILGAWCCGSKSAGNRTAKEQFERILPALPDDFFKAETTRPSVKPDDVDVSALVSARQERWKSAVLATNGGTESMPSPLSDEWNFRVFQGVVDDVIREGQDKKAFRPGGIILDKPLLAPHIKTPVLFLPLRKAR